MSVEHIKLAQATKKAQEIIANRNKKIQYALELTKSLQKEAAWGDIFKTMGQHLKDISRKLKINKVKPPIQKVKLQNPYIQKTKNFLKNNKKLLIASGASGLTGGIIGAQIAKNQNKQQ
jgi:hypothetical protein